MAKQATKRVLAAQAQAKPAATSPTHEEIAALAYSLWRARGGVEGTPEQDWFNAERALKTKAGV